MDSLEDVANLIRPYSILTKVFISEESKKLSKRLRSYPTPRIGVIHITVGLVKYHLLRVIRYLGDLPVPAYAFSTIAKWCNLEKGKRIIALAIAAAQVLGKNLTNNEELRMEADLVGAYCNIDDFKKLKNLISSDRTATFYLKVCLAASISLAHEVRNGRKIEDIVDTLNDTEEDLHMILQKAWAKIFLHIAPLVIERRIATIKLSSPPVPDRKQEYLLMQLEALTPILND